MRASHPCAHTQIYMYIQHMEYCENNPDQFDKVAAVQKQVDEVKNVMIENIEKVLDRGEKIELLVDRTQTLRNSAGTCV